MADYNPNNLPGQEGYQYKAPPGYVPVSQQEQSLLQNFLSSIGGGAFGNAFSQAQGALGTPGAYDVAKGGLKNLAHFVGGAGKQADAYKKAALGATRRAGLEGLRLMSGQQGAAGTLGSTVAGVDKSTLLGTGLQQMNEVIANAEQMREQNMLQRLQTGAQGLLGLAGTAGNQREQNLLATQNLAQMAGAQDLAGQQQRLQGLAALQGQRTEPMEWAYNLWGPLQSPNKQGGMFGDFLGLANVAASAFGIPGLFDFGGGGSGGKK